MAFIFETLQTFKHLLQSSSGSTASQSDEPSAAPLFTDTDSASSESTGEDINSDYLGILDTDLTSLTRLQQNIFTVVIVVLSVLSIFGNVGTLYVNARRKIRPFFRACIISLAFSDLLNTGFLSMAYMSQFNAQYVQIWTLGHTLCNVVPFATTTAILASSMALVGIGLDRYFAVIKARINSWNPSLICCVSCVIGIWTASMFIACPVFFIYELFHVYILTVESPDTTTTPPVSVGDGGWELGVAVGTTSSWQQAAEDSDEDLSYTLVESEQLVHMCMSNQKVVAMYYIIVFAIIFIPCIVAFVLFNAIIAKKLWSRRHPASVTKIRTREHFSKKSKPAPTENINEATTVSGLAPNPANHCTCQHGPANSLPMPQCCTARPKDGATPFQMLGTPDTPPTPTPSGRTAAPPPPKTGGNSGAREARHIRMFTIIVLMVATFIFFRLPAWIFLLMRMYGNYAKPIHWILYFAFGALNLASCMLNPLFYTFLTETIQCALFVKGKVCAGVWGLRLCCRDPQSSQTGDDLSLEAQADALDEGGTCCLSAFCISIKFAPHIPPPPGSPPQIRHTWTSKQDDEHEVIVNNDNDEGVECGGDLSDDGESLTDFYEFNHRVYTIFPPSLVSSSMST